MSAQLRQDVDRIEANLRRAWARYDRCSLPRARQDALRRVAEAERLLADARARLADAELRDAVVTEVSR